MATVTGISASRYYVNNPIWVTVDRSLDADPSEPVIMTISSDGNTLFTSKYYTYNGLVVFDLAEIIKGLLPEPNHPISPVSGQPIQLSTINATITLPSFTSSKTFFRGGEDSQRTNIQVPNNAVLSESEKLPVWSGYPSAKYYIGISGFTYYTSFLDISEIDTRRVPTCNPVFLRFLNTKGGYSFWLFEEWEIQKKTKKGIVIERRVNDLDLGLEVEHTLSISTRSEQRYFQTMRALAQSPEVYIYNIQDIVTESNPQYKQSFLWTRIFNEGSNPKWNEYESVQEFDFKFDLRLRNKPSLIW